jgi:hypothetical protein
MPQISDYIADTKPRVTPLTPDEPVGLEYARLPKPKARFQGLTRSTLLEIGNQVPGMVITIRKRKNAQRGIRLLHLPTFFRYLESLKEKA